MENVDDLPVLSVPLAQTTNVAMSVETLFVLPKSATVPPSFAFAGGGADRCPSTR